MDVSEAPGPYFFSAMDGVAMHSAAATAARENPMRDMAPPMIVIVWSDRPIMPQRSAGDPVVQRCFPTRAKTRRSSAATPPGAT